MDKIQNIFKRSLVGITCLLSLASSCETQPGRTRPFEAERNPISEVFRYDPLRLTLIEKYGGSPEDEGKLLGMLSLVDVVLEERPGSYECLPYAVHDRCIENLERLGDSKFSWLKEKR